MKPDYIRVVKRTHVVYIVEQVTFGDKYVRKDGEARHKRTVHVVGTYARKHSAEASAKGVRAALARLDEVAK